MFRTLLVPLDRSPLAEQAIGQAAAIARASDARLDVVLVHQPFPFAGFDHALWTRDRVADDERYLEAIVGELASGATRSTTHAVLHGEAAEMICARAQEVAADLIVLTSHGRTGLSRAWLGSVADGVMRRSAIPVLMLRPVEEETDRDAAHQLFKRLLVPIDGSALGAEILGPAGALAAASGARMDLLRVVQPLPLVAPDFGAAGEAALLVSFPASVRDDAVTERLVVEAREQMSDVAQTLAQQGAGTVETHVVVDERVAHAILEFARRISADVIAMSTHGRGASRLVLGSVADKVIRGSGLPMLIQRPALR